MRSATLVKSPDEAGLKPFSWTKAKSALRNWNLEELRAVSDKIVSLYHDSRRGEHELVTALEKFILDL
jgi:hypothetical protein